MPRSFCAFGPQHIAPWNYACRVPVDADADEATALQDFMLAALKSFVRRYNVQCAQIAERIGSEVLGAESVPVELREAVEHQLNL